MLGRDEYIKSGWENFRSLKYHLAGENFKAALELDNYSFEAHFGLGRVCFEIQEPGAISAFSKAIATNANFGKAYYYRGRSRSLFPDESGESKKMIAGKTALDYARALHIAKMPSNILPQDVLNMNHSHISEMQEHITMYKKLRNPEIDLFKTIDKLAFRERYLLFCLFASSEELKSLFGWHIKRLHVRKKEVDNAHLFKFFSFTNLPLLKDITHLIKETYTAHLCEEPKKKIFSPR